MSDVFVIPADQRAFADRKPSAEDFHVQRVRLSEQAMLLDFVGGFFGLCDGCDNPACRKGGCQGRK